MINLLSLFSGIGAFEKALINLNIDINLIGYSEFDKYASKAYSLIHNISEEMNLGDITLIDETSIDSPVDLITYGFPCQDISVAGNLKGFTDEDGTKTRSGLFFDALRIITHTQPKIAIAENVKNLVGKRFKDEFEIVLQSLEDAGYNNYWKVLNAKDYGIPQNRERVFIVSIRKDLDTGIFEFPEPYELELRLKDVLEDEVDEKYFLSDEKQQLFMTTLKGKIEAGGIDVSRKGEQFEGVADVARTLMARDYKGLDNTIKTAVLVKEPVRLGNIYGDKFGTGYAGNVWDKEAISPTLMTMQGGNRQPMVIVKEATKKGYKEAYEGDSINLEQPNSKTRRGWVGKGVAQTLTTSPQQAVVVNYRIRKLTPKECFRLMGFDDEDCDILMENKISNTQLYKQAGNSIVVDVAEEILCQLLDDENKIYV